MIFNKNSLYLDDVKEAAKSDFPWDKMMNKSIFISGASGLIGSFLIDVIMYRNKYFAMNCKIYALGRNENKAFQRFEEYWNMSSFKFLSYDINEPISFEVEENIDYIIHLASNTHPVAYATDPIGTITTNIIGTKNLLDFAYKHHTQRFVFASSNEIYGENRGDIEKFDETYCGYIDSNTMRAGYPESKRCGEALCQAYIKQKDLDVVIPRFTRSYGPSMLMGDTKAMSQFIKNGIYNEDIILKSEGNQYYSYTYVSDAVTGLLAVLLLGKKGEAYNISDEKSDIKLKDLAKVIANFSGTKVVFELPNQVENIGFSKATKARLDSKKINELGWFAKYTIDEGVKRTINILKDTLIIKENEKCI